MPSLRPLLASGRRGVNVPAFDIQKNRETAQANSRIELSISGPKRKFRNKRNHIREYWKAFSRILRAHHHAFLRANEMHAAMQTTKGLYAPFGNVY